MSINIPDHYTISFSTNVMLLLQIKGSKLRPCVTEGTYTGKQASPVDQIGSVEMQDVTGRFQPKVRTDANVDRRWVTPSDFDLTQSIDTFDKLKTAIEPTSQYSDVAAAAVAREWDDRLIAAALGTASLGTDGASSDEAVRIAGPMSGPVEPDLKLFRRMVEFSTWQ